MTVVVPAHMIEQIVGVGRHPSRHYARAVSAERIVYVLHSQACVDDLEDLRACPFSRSLDLGIQADQWIEDVSTIVEIDDQTGRLVPIGGRP